MAPDPVTLARVQRLLNGAASEADMQSLFLYARGRCNGRQDVQEIGDFVAHYDERDRGIVTDLTREFAVVIRFTMQKFFADAHGYDMVSRIPALGRDYLEISLRRMGRSIRSNGFHPKQARTLLPIAQSAMKPNSDGTWRIETDDAQIREFIDVLLTSFSNYPVVTGNKLFLGFQSTLVENGALAQSELKEFARSKRAVILFAVSLLHGFRIDIGGGIKVELCAADARGLVDVICPVPFIDPVHLKTSKMGFSIMTSEIETSEACSSYLLARDNWNFPITVDGAGKLTKLQ